MWRNLLGRAAKTQSKPYKLFMYGIYNVVGSQKHPARTRGPRHLLAALQQAIGTKIPTACAEFLR